MTPYDAPGHASCLMRCQFFAFCKGARLDAPDGCRALVMAGRPLMAVGDINHQRGYVVILHIYIYIYVFNSVLYVNIVLYYIILYIDISYYIYFTYYVYNMYYIYYKYVYCV